jgi:hypothetical protein
VERRRGGDAPRIGTVYGVDFSGARLAGLTTWVAEAAVGDGAGGAPGLTLTRLNNLAELGGSERRAEALAHLVERISGSHDALWAIGAPFGLPVEVLDEGARWPALLRWVRGWEEDAAYALGLWALGRARSLGGPGHIYRATDRAARTPFDAYHYRVVYQTFHGMRDVLWPAAQVRETAILPFHHRRLGGARRVVVETCQSSTLKRLGLPHQNYKQPEGGALTARRRRTRHEILAGLAPLVAVPDDLRRRVMRDPGGDALDAVIAAAGAWDAFGATDHAAVARDGRFSREGYQYY